MINMSNFKFKSFYSRNDNIDWNYQRKKNVSWSIQNRTQLTITLSYFLYECFIIFTIVDKSQATIRLRRAWFMEYYAYVAQEIYLLSLSFIYLHYKLIIKKLLIHFLKRVTQKLGMGVLRFINLLQFWYVYFHYRKCFPRNFSKPWLCILHFFQKFRFLKIMEHYI